MDVQGNGLLIFTQPLCAQGPSFRRQLGHLIPENLSLFDYRGYQEGKDASDEQDNQQVNDNDGQHQQNLIPGDGNFDFRLLIQELIKVGYDGVLTAELGYYYTSDPTPATKENIKRMRVLLEEA